MRDETKALPTFEAFYRDSYPGAVRLATFLAGMGNAEDVVQDCFAALHDRYAALDHPRAYLHVSVANRCRALQRGAIRRDGRDRLVAKPDLVDPQHREMLDLLAALPYNQRAVLVLRLWAGWSDDRIAAVLGCRPSTVRSHARRALACLRKELET